MKWFACVFLSFSLFAETITIRGETSDIIHFVKSYLPDKPIILEAGAFNGNDTIQIAKHLSDGFLHAFEPIPELFDLVVKKTQDLPNVKCYRQALSDSTGTSQFYVSFYYDQLGASSSLLAPKEHLQYAPEITFSETILVETISLDDWALKNGIERVDFLWLDMQGFELHMLKSSKIAKSATAIYTEISFVEAYAGQYLYNDLLNWMEENGFELVAFVSEKDWYGNALFIRY